MNRNRFTPARPLWVFLSVAGLLALGNHAWAADTPVASPSEMQSRGARAEAPKPILPNKSELPDSAFKKLDPAAKGYVAKEDIKGLEGFDKIFDKVDSKHTGKLNQAQFKKAWNQYAAEKSSDSTGKAAW